MVFSLANYLLGSTLISSPLVDQDTYTKLAKKSSFLYSRFPRIIINLVLATLSLSYKSFKNSSINNGDDYSFVKKSVIMRELDRMDQKDFVPGNSEYVRFKKIDFKDHKEENMETPIDEFVPFHFFMMLMSLFVGNIG